MNRQQSRKLRRDAKKKGVNEAVTELFIHMKNAGFDTPNPPQEIHTGDRVALDLDKIKKRRDYDRMLPAYKDFVEHSEGQVFTATQEQKNLISLQEKPKWLFWSGDLQIIERCGEAIDGTEGGDEP